MGGLWRFDAATSFPALMRNVLPQLRAEKAWTQGDLAKRLGVSRQTVNALETSRYDPSLPLAFAIAALFDQPIEAIFRPNSKK
jgi:putative transcriptional regulator